MHSLTLAVYVLVVVQGCVRDSESNWDFSYIIDKALYIYIYIIDIYIHIFFLFYFIFIIFFLAYVVSYIFNAVI